MTVHRPRQETLNDYAGFVDKFKAKKTTDDCYTPAAVYEAVKDWAVEEYGLQGREIVRPFCPGGDYESFDYPDNCVVIDNPPFSIISKIAKDYSQWGVDYFLFAPTLTNLSIKAASCHIIVGVTVIYANGAKVNTSFITSLDSPIARTAPSLGDSIKLAQKIEKAEKPKLPKYRYPDNLVTVNDLNKLSNAGIDFRVSDGIYVRKLDSQKPLKKAIFGNGLLISDKDAELKRAELKRAERERERAERERAELKRAELKRAEREAIPFELSERERRMVESIR